MMTSSNGQIFRVAGHLCGEFIVQNGEFPAQRPLTRSFDVVSDLRLYKRLSKQWWGWWFETPWRPLWGHCNVMLKTGKNSHPQLATISKKYPGFLFVIDRISLVFLISSYAELVLGVVMWILYGTVSITLQSMNGNLVRVHDSIDQWQVHLIERCRVKWVCGRH